MSELNKALFMKDKGGCEVQHVRSNKNEQKVGGLI